MSFKHFTAFIALASLANAALVPRVTCSDGSVVGNEKCCCLFPVLKDIQENLFEGGKCGEDAHSAVRIAFHDAIGYSLNNKDFGDGADGSIITFAETETTYPANGGIDDIIKKQKPFIEKWGMTAGDFIQFAAAVGLSNCPGAPQLRFQLGRPKAKRPAVDKTVPEPDHDVTTILSRFEDAGFGPEAVVALLASHSIAAADKIDESVAGAPLDSTPDIFDSQFFVETLLVGEAYPGNGQNKGEVPAPYALKGEMRLQSDQLIARDPRTACYWQKNIDDEDYMRSSFQKYMEQVATLGQDKDNMIDCSDVIPPPKPRVGKPHLPAGSSLDQIEKSCDQYPFPALTADPGPPTPVGRVSGAS